MAGQVCCKPVYSPGALIGNRCHPCGAKAKHIRDGKPYCGRHDPVARKAKDDAKTAARAAGWERLNASRAKAAAEAAEQKRRAECYDDLLAALTDLADIIDAAGLVNLSCGVQLGPTVWFVKASDRLGFARAAIAKAQP